MKQKLIATIALLSLLVLSVFGQQKQSGATVTQGALVTKLNNVGLVRQDVQITTISGALTGSLTLNCAGSNREIVVTVTYYDAARAVSTITYNTTDNLTKYATITGGGANQSADIWHLVAPSSGSHTLLVTMTNGTSWAGITARCYSGANQSTPLGTAATATATSTAPSITVTSAVGEEVIDAVAINGQSGNPTVTVGAGQTQRQNEGIAGIEWVVSSDEPGAASVVMDWTSSLSLWWAAIGVSVKPA